MKMVRLLLPLCLLVFGTSLAFAGPQIGVADPGCTGTSVYTNSFNFSFDPQNPVLTFCNGTTSTTWESLNLTITFQTAIDLAGIYCGGPDASPHAAFDYCMVLDPTLPNQTYNEDPAYGQLITSYLVHEFVASGVGDGPSNFYSSPSTCFFNCDNSGGPAPADYKNLVNISFNLAPPVFYALDDIDNDPQRPGSGAEGWKPGTEITIDLGCKNTQQNCFNWADGTQFRALTSESSNTTVFPQVPEPATILLFVAGIPAVLFRRKRR